MTSDLEVLDLGSVGAYPSRPTGGPVGGLAAAARLGARHIASLESAFLSAPLDVEVASLDDIYDSGLTAVAGRAPSVEFVSRSEDGTDIALPAAQVPEGRRLGRNDGFVVHDVDGISPSVNLLAGRLAVAQSTRVIPRLLFGSLAAGDDAAPVSEVFVLPLNGSAIIRTSAQAPQEVAAGHLMRCDDWPRVHTDPAVCTLLVGVGRLGGHEMRDAILRRAAHHPLVRLDAASVPHSPVDAYGIEGTVDYTTLLNSAVAQVLDETSGEDLMWWWTLDQRLRPLGVPGQNVEGVLGRFPGGVGVVGNTEDGRVLLKAAGHTLAASDDALDMIESLLSGAVVECAGRHVGPARALLDAGLAEPVIGQPATVIHRLGQVPSEEVTR